MHRFGVAVILAASVLLGTRVAAAPDPAAKCEADKNSAAGRYAACLYAAQAKAVKANPAAPAPDFSRCDAKLLAKWDKIETKGGEACPTTGDDTAIQALVGAQAATVAGALSGDGVPICGNETVDSVGEECDGADLKGKACTNFGHAGGTLGCSTLCQYDTVGCCDAFVGGACWYFGLPGASCVDTCAAQGLVYDEATLTFAGSAGSFAQCAAVLDAVHAPTDVFATPDTACDTAVGCVHKAGFGRFRCISLETTAEAFDPGPTGAARACACTVPAP
jgi:hypothetical protein